MITIDYQDKRPIYEQIADKMALLILRGILPPGEKLPSVRSLAVDLSINPNTIQRADTLLEYKGYVYPVRGKGSFVADCSEIRKLKEDRVEKEFASGLMKLKTIGYSKEECQALLEACWKGDRHD